MDVVLYIIVGVAMGAVAGIYIGILRGRAALSGDVAALNATGAEIRSQLLAREAELTALRETLSRQEKTAAESQARLESAREHFAEQRRQIEEMEKRVKETFAALSGAALKSSNEQFMTLADAKMKPLREQLERYETHIKELEKTRAEAYGGLSKQLQRIEEGREMLSRETRQLVAAMRQSGAKGRWGEVTLRNVVELCGMSAYCDFNEQATLATPDARLRPDMVVKLPGGRSLVIDSKVNATAYLDAIDAPSEDEKNRQLGKFVSDVRGTLKSLSAKEYWNRLGQTPEFVVMFMPGEAFFAAAIAKDSALIEDGMNQRVLIASPTTLAALLMAIRYGWQQQQVAENAEKIAAAGRDLYDRLSTFSKYLDDIRGGIEKAAKAYDQAVGNWESRTLPGAKRLKELDAAAANKELTELRRTELNMRQVSQQDAE